MVLFSYRPDVDGLRAIAVILVLLFHAGVGITGGFVGVDVFFVISGFLITGLILRELDAGQFSLTNFWLRRIRRIIPAATVMVVAVLAAGHVLLLPVNYADVAKSAIAQQLMAANVFFWRSHDYFHEASELKPLLHTWSLAVEEQFYLGYPFLLMGLHRWGRRATAVALTLLCLASLAASVYGVQHYPKATFYLLPTRAWELLIGGLICFLPRPSRVPFAWLAAASWLSLAGIFGTAWQYDSVTPFPGLAALLPCGATAVFIYANSYRLTLPATIVASRPVVFMGLISYSLYLWHWPILAFCRYWLGDIFGPGLGLLATAGSVPLAIASWKYVETPLRSGLSNRRSITVISLAALSAAAVTAFAYGIYFTEGYGGRWPEAVRRLAASVNTPRKPSVGLRELRCGELPVIGVSEGTEQPVDFLLWGDSHAQVLAACLDELAKNRMLRGKLAVRPATVPLLGVWRPYSRGQAAEAPLWNQAVLDYIRQSQVKHVVLASRWQWAIEPLPSGNVGCLIADYGEMKATADSAAKVFDEALARTLEDLESMDVKVWVLKQVPQQRWDPLRTMVRSLYLGGPMQLGVSLAEHSVAQEKPNTIIDRNVAGRPLVCAIDTSASFFNGQQHTVLGDERGCFYRDDDHVSDLGAQVYCRQTLDSILAAIARDLEGEQQAR